MGKFEKEYEVDGEKYAVKIKTCLLAGRVSVTINDQKFVMRSAPFAIKRCEPFMVGDSRKMLTVSVLGKIKVD